MMRPPSGGPRLGSVVLLDEREHGVLVRTGLGDVELPDTMISGGTVVAGLNDVMTHAQHLDGDIHANLQHIMQDASGQRFYNDWITWYAQYFNFYAAHTGPHVSTLTSYFGGETVASLRSQAAQYNDFEARYRSITGLTPSFNPGPPDPNVVAGLPIAAWVGIGAGTVALVAIAWSLSSAAKITAPLRGLRGRRRRR